MARFGARVTFDNAAVASITGRPDGEVYRYLVTSGRAIARQARATAPVRTGRLKSSISARIVHADYNSTTVRVTAGAPYAVHVHNGTGGPSTIHAQAKGYRLYTRPPNAAGAAAAGYPDWVGGWKPTFRGQRAKPFISNAFRAWATTNGFSTAGIKRGFF